MPRSLPRIATAVTVVAATVIGTAPLPSGADTSVSSHRTATTHHSTRHTAGLPLVFRGSSSAHAVIASPKVYVVFYGRQWGRPTTVRSDLMFSADPLGVAPRTQQFLRGLYGTEHWSTSTTQYCDQVPTGTTRCPLSAHHVGHPNTSPLAGVWFDNTYDAVSGASESSIRASALRAAKHFGNLTAASNASALYVVMTPHGVGPSGFGTQFCAYHGDDISSVGPIAYTALPYIPDAGHGCGQNAVHAGAAGTLDGVSMVAGHEYAEWLTDPFGGTGWVDARGYENADKCAWIASGPGRAADVVFPTGTFPVQSLWSNSANGGQGGCVTYFAGTAAQH